ncbi:unnamed protein product [Cochlearia groenlandica]
MADKLAPEKRHDFTHNHDLSAPVKADSSVSGHYYETSFPKGWDNAHYPAEEGERADMGVAYFRTGSVRYLCHRFRTEAAHASDQQEVSYV